MSQIELISFASDRELAHAAATAWLDAIEAARRQDRSHLVALSGGRIAKTLFAAVTAQARSRNASLEHVHFFWADERCVPPQDAESNFAIADQTLFQPLRLCPAQIHRLRGEDDPETAARAAAAELCRVAPLSPAGQPVLDLILLGMGEDGHVASLFPGSQPTTLATAIYQPVVAAKPPPRRLTLTYAVIHAAQEVWVLASGSGKERALETSLASPPQTPLATVIAGRQRTRIFTDINRKASAG